MIRLITYMIRQRRSQDKFSHGLINYNILVTNITNINCKVKFQDFWFYNQTKPTLNSKLPNGTGYLIVRLENRIREINNHIEFVQERMKKKVILGYFEVDFEII